MGFLYGVLGAVKNENEVTTYDNYITPDNKNLKSVLDTLTKNIGSGRKGLAASVEQVKGWLEKYNSQVETLTSAVTTKLGTLSSNLSSGTGKYYTEVTDQATSPLADQLSTWTETVKKIEAEVENINKAVNVLDDRLRERVMHEMKVVEKAAKMLADSAAVPGLGDQVRKVDRTLEEKKREVTREIARKSEEFKWNMQTKFTEIIGKIGEIGSLRNTGLAPLLASVAKLETAVGQAEREAIKLHSNYDTHMVAPLENINEQFLRLETGHITRELQNVYRLISPLMERLGSQLREVGWSGNNVKKTVKEGLSDIARDLEGMIAALKQRIKNNVKGYVRDTLPGIMKKAIEKRTDFIAKRKDSPQHVQLGSLDRIVEGIKEYSSRFKMETTRNGFQQTVQHWIRDILEENILVKQWLGAYFEKNDGEFAGEYRNARNNREIYSKIADKIAAVITQQLEVKFGVTPGSVAIPSDAGDSVQANIEAVNTRINEFVKQLGRAIDEKRASGTITDFAGKVGNLVEDIATEIESKMKPDVLNGAATEKDNLEYAIAATLTAVHSAARQAAKQLHCLLKTCHLGNVDAAMNKVRGIGMEVQEEIKEIGNTPDGRGETLGEEINNGLGNEAVSITVKDPLNYFLNKAAGRGIDMVDEKINALLGQLSDVEPAIKGELNKLYRDSLDDKRSGAIQRHMGDLQARITKLKPVISSVNTMAKGAIKGQIRDLKNGVAELKQSIATINENINKLNRSLEEATDGAKLTVLRAKATLAEAITSLNDILTKTAKEAFDEIKRETESMFAKQHEADLTGFKKLFDEQKEGIQGIIHKDKESGLKGFMNTLNKQFVPEIPDFGNTKDTTFRRVADELNEGFQDFLKEFEKQDVMIPCVKHIYPVSRTLDVLLSQMKKSQHLDSEVTKRRLDLENALSEFNAEKFHDAVRVICVPLKIGLQKFVDELKNAYVNSYEGGAPITQWVTDDAEQNKQLGAGQNGDQEDDQSAKQKYKLTNEGRKGAKVFLTLLTTLYNYLHYLFYNCSTWWNKYAIDGSMTTDQSRYSLGKYLASQGFDVVNLITKDHSGWHVAIKLSKGFNGHGEFIRQPDKGKIYEVYIDSIKKSEHPGILQKLFDYLCTYYQVCHLILPKTAKYPCTVRDMLSWLTGLTHSTVYTKINKQSESLLKEKDNVTGKMPYYDDFVIRRILTSELYYSLYSTCRISYDALTTIQGHGHGFDQADYPYACNFMDNSRGFHYPDSVGSLFDMLSDICRRLLYALYYTYSRCRTPSHVHGWRSCQYGKGIDSFNWDCNKHPGGKSNCQARSSLQSHLMDNLAGFLPHKVASNGTSLSCSSCKFSQPGQQCVTPMGFSDLSSAGSRNGTGEDICNVLKGFCGNADSPLCSLLRCLSTLCPVAPKGLAEMFSLFCNIMQRSHNSKYTFNDGYKSALDGAIGKCFPLWPTFHGSYESRRLTDALKSLHCSTHIPTNPLNDKNHCDLWSISRPTFNDSYETCDTVGASCASYLQPLSLHSHHTFADKHAGLYLSWIVYLTETFWKLLHDLLTAFRNMSCKHYGCSSCNCASGKHGVCEDDASGSSAPPKPGCHCSSIVDCRGVLSIFCKYGFTFRVPRELIGNSSRKCDDFQKQLHRVLFNGYFDKLFEEIDEFLLAIRFPFMSLTLALWLLSLLYLLHIMVIRLDLLHIKSHLHSPSSHRIAAQSLLAAARVKTLNKVFYLQP